MVKIAYIIVFLLWGLSALWITVDARRKGFRWVIWGIATLFFWIIPLIIYLFKRPPSPRRTLNIPLPKGLQLVDRYLYLEIIKMTVVTVFGIAFIILANNIYNSADMMVRKDLPPVPLKIIAEINLLDTPAMVVLAFPVATLIGVMLALGILGQGSEITAMRTGGLSLSRLIIPVIIISLGFSVLTYFLSQRAVPWCGEKSQELKTIYIAGERADEERNPIFKSENMVIYAARFNTKNKQLTKITVYEKDELGWYHFRLAFSGSFNGDQLILNDVKKYITDGLGKLQRYEVVPREALPFPRELQEIHETKRDSFSYAAGDLATKIQRFQESGIDPLAAEIDQQFQISVPLACTIFAFVGFIFSLYNPRKEASVGVLYAILIAFVYYVFMAFIRTLAKHDQEILKNPYIAAWLTNVVFAIFGAVLFWKVRK